MKTTEQLDRIRDCRPVNHDRGRGHGDTNEGIESHRGWQCERLAKHLLALITREPRKVWNIQRYGCPETYRTIQRRNQKLQKVGEVCESRRRGQHGAEAARIVIGPSQK